MTVPAGPSGPEWVIRHGEHEANIVTVGGALRRYTHAGLDVVHGFAATEPSPACRGKLLAPWPNRIRDGVYTYDGTEHELALTEPQRHNAIHGLLMWQAFEARVVADDAVTLGTVVYPQPGYAATLDVEVAYAVSDDGLTVTVTARNLSDVAAPFGCAAHPYLTAGEERVDDLEITLPAQQYLPVDADRLLPPVGTADAVDVDDDRRLDGRPLGSRSLDTAYTALRADADGRWRARLHHKGVGRSTTLWAQASAFGWAQVFTGDALPEPATRRTGVALEPMTCPPDAFTSGVDVVRLEPGDAWSGEWGISPG